jgi:hypothetical protein
MRALYACLLILALLPAFGFAQPSRPDQQKPDQQKDPAYELWRIRSQTITDDLLKDATDLSPTRRAVLLVRLSQRWWRDDRRSASNWIRNAIEVVEQVPNKESPEDRRQRLETARLLLQAVAPLDQKLGQRLVTVLTKDGESSTTAERSENVDGLLNAALSLVDQDPKRAAELGGLALRIGPPTDIASLLLSLRRRDVKLADALLVQALAAARQNPSPQLLNSITDASFPAQKGIGANVPVPPDPLLAELLQLDIAYLNANPIDAENQNTICMSLGAFIAPVLTEFDRLTPQQSPVARQAISKCQSLAPLAQQRIDDSSSSQPLDTVEALLKAAADAKDSKVRTVYEYRAATLAKEKKEYDLALKILDGMAKESREFMGGSWEAYRWDWAALSALEHYKQGRLHEMNGVLNAVPLELQPFAKAAFVDRVPVRKDQEGNPTLQFLNDARVSLRQSTIPESEKYSWYFGLLRLTVKYQPSEASAAFKEAIASLNRAEQGNETKGQANKLDTTELSKTLPASLLEMDEFTVKEGIASVSSVETRAQLRLELLDATLQRMRNAQRSDANAKTNTSIAQ